MRHFTALLCCLVLAAPTLARAYCIHAALHDDNNNIVYNVPVYLVAPNATFAGWDKYVVAHELEVAVDNWHEEAATHIRPYFAGILSSAGVPTNGQVYVKEETSNCNRCDMSAAACESTTQGGWPYYYSAVGSTIWIVDKPGACDFDWGVYSVTYTFGGVFTHEFGHSLGIDDESPISCDGYVQSVMAGNCHEGRFITRRDIGSLGLLGLGYAPRARSYVYTESSDWGLSWVYGSPQDLAYSAYLRIGTSGYLSTGATEIYAQAMINNGWFRGTKVWKGQPGQTHTYVQPDNGLNSYSWDVASAAYRDATHYAVAYRADEREDHCLKGVRLAITDNGGTNWTHLYVRDPPGGPGAIETYGEGVALTYDPRSDTYVVVYANNDDLITQTTFAALPPHTQGPIYTLQDHYVLDYPAIACNQQSIAGTNNCVLAWNNVGAYNTIRWNKGYIATSGLTPGKFIGYYATPPNTGYLGWQSPSLASMTNAYYPWILGFKQGSNFYTMRYSIFSGGFGDVRGAFTGGSGGILSGALAEFFYGTYREIHVKGVTD